MRDTRVEYHVYANPASQLLHQAGQASKRQISRFGKGIRRSSQRLTHCGKCRRRPSLMVFLKLPVTRDSRVLESEQEPRLKSGPDSLAPCPALALNTDSISCLPDDKLTRLRRENKSCEDLSQINPLPKLRVTNPDLPSTIALGDHDPYEGTYSASTQQSLDRLRNISKNLIHDGHMHPLSKDPAEGGLTELDSETRTAQEQELEWPRSWHDGSTYSRPDTYELWLPESVSRSPSSDPPLVCALLSRSHHKSDSAFPSRNLPPPPQAIVPAVGARRPSDG